MLGRREGTGAGQNGDDIVRSEVGRGPLPGNGRGEMA